MTMAAPQCSAGTPLAAFAPCPLHGECCDEFRRLKAEVERLREQPQLTAEEAAALVGDPPACDCGAMLYHATTCARSAWDRLVIVGRAKLRALASNPEGTDG
jgi:hypothetical protein